jgi:hypothetical protein
MRGSFDAPAGRVRGHRHQVVKEKLTIEIKVHKPRITRRKTVCCAGCDV